MNNFEREEYKKLLSDYTKASERILELKKENKKLKDIAEKYDKFLEYLDKYPSDYAMYIMDIDYMLRNGV